MYGLIMLAVYGFVKVRVIFSRLRVVSDFMWIVPDMRVVGVKYGWDRVMYSWIGVSIFGNFIFAPFFIVFLW